MKLDVTDNEELPLNCREVLFVLYNCARLSKILEKHEKKVEEGTWLDVSLSNIRTMTSLSWKNVNVLGIYPVLPEINDVDFSLLKDEVFVRL